MEDSDKKEILDAFSTLGVSMEERMGSLTQEMREGFSKVDKRLCSLEDEVKAISTTLDSLIEGTTIGTENIMLTRPEYDSLMEGAHLPNRFAH